MNQNIRDVAAKQVAYNGVYQNVSNIYELRDKYKSENDELAAELSKTKSDTVTNDRKAYYEDQGTATLDAYYWYIRAAYIIAFLFAVALLFNNPAIDIKQKFGYTLAFLVYPFIASYLGYFVIKVHDAILPNNVLLQQIANGQSS